MKNPIIELVCLTFSTIRSFINSIVLIVSFGFEFAWSNSLTIVSIPPCSRKFNWPWGKFRRRVESVKRRRICIWWFFSIFNKRNKYCTKPRLNPFDWTFGFLKMNKFQNEMILLEIPCRSYPWKAAPAARLVRDRTSRLVSVELSNCMNRSNPFLSAKRMALSYWNEVNAMKSKEFYLMQQTWWR